MDFSRISDVIIVVSFARTLKTLKWDFFSHILQYRVLELLTISRLNFIKNLSSSFDGLGLNNNSFALYDKMRLLL